MFSLDDIVEGEQYIFLLGYFPTATKRASTDLSLMVPLHFLNTVHRLIDVLQRGLHLILNCSSIDMIPEIARTLLQLVEAELASTWCVIVFVSDERMMMMYVDGVRMAGTGASSSRGTLALGERVLLL
jgi:hypothetical protein